MFALYDPQSLALIRTVQSGRRLRAPSGATFEDASAVDPATLRQHGVYPVTDPGQPDLTGKRLVGVSVPAELASADDDVVLTYQTEDLSAEELAADLAAYLPGRRWQAEVAGIIWSGWPVATDRESQSKISAAYMMARDGHWPEVSGGWKFGDGVWRAMTAEQVTALALAVSAHVQTAFALEGQLAAGLQAGTVTTRAEIDAAFVAIEPVAVEA